MVFKKQIAIGISPRLGSDKTIKTSIKQQSSKQRKKQNKTQNKKRSQKQIRKSSNIPVNRNEK